MTKRDRLLAVVWGSLGLGAGVGFGMAAPRELAGMLLLLLLMAVCLTVSITVFACNQSLLRQRDPDQQGDRSGDRPLR
jgi:hypothetical protein